MPNSATAAGSIETTTALLREELPQLEQHQQALEKDLAAVTERLESVRSALTALQALSTVAIPAPRSEVRADAGEAVQSAVATPEAEPVSEAVPEAEVAPEAELETVPETELEKAPETETATAQDAPAPRTRRATASGRKSTAKKTTKRTTKPAAKPRQAKKTDTAKKTTAVKAPKARKTAAKDSSPAPDNTGGLTDQVAAVLARSGDTPLRARDVAKELGRDDTTGAINTVRSTLDRLVATSRARRAGRGLYQAPAN
ncbi:hypothetical protein AMK26_20510 [Streptomyces sp. CB03234]|uniref:hypothetical protein n=1 Tax=Streptomyces sp. (strain CB03234) TaxID=1703937 RepID=UPI00093E5F74|nr:hypothetical protein [Streptomyces sp. CB03234]OKK03795.1 hypothetical protein AMK26_20510 [Streptomyces sp. CB03234]